MPVTSVTKDAATLTLTIVADFPVPQQRLWDAYADPRQLERFWGPPTWPATFTRHDFKVGGRSEYFLTGPNGEKWTGSWKFLVVNPISYFEAEDGDGDVTNGPASMKFNFETTATGSRLTAITLFASVEAMENLASGFEEGVRAALPQLDALFAEMGASPAARA